MLTELVHTEILKILDLLHDALHVATAFIEQHADVRLTSQRKPYHRLYVVAKIVVFLVKLERDNL